MVRGVIGGVREGHLDVFVDKKGRVIGMVIRGLMRSGEVRR